MYGKTIGNYIVRHKLGEGGMGSVYFAEHPSIGKRVALKVLHADYASQPEIVSRFFNEAKAVNDIQHPNIVDIVDFGILPAATAAEPPLVYFIMEYIEGVSLSELIRRESPLAPERAVTIALQIADALSASHRKGVVHRDLKPDNVILVSRGRQHDFVKLLDFGIAKLTANAASSHRTRTGIVMGTPQYMSPEQCDGRGRIDHRSDIYALGIVLYQMLTGRVPFGGDGYGEVLIQQMSKAPLAPSSVVPSIPEHLELVVLKALEKQPDHRYQDMDETMLALQNPLHYVATHGARTRFLVSPVRRDVPPAGSSMPLAAQAVMPDRVAPTTLSGSAAQLVATPVPTPSMMIPPTAPPTASPASRSRAMARFGLAVALVLGGIAVGIVIQVSGVPPAPASAPSPVPAVAPSPPAAASPAPAPAPAASPAPSTATSPAPAPAAAAAVAPAAVRTPTKIRITIASVPPGAAVMIDGESRGKTPYAGELERTDAPAEIKLTLAGYLATTRKITLGDDVALSISLEPAPRAPARPPRVPDPQAPKDPFEQLEKKKGQP
jgi:serine/threonine protein kinase